MNLPDLVLDFIEELPLLYHAIFSLSDVPIEHLLNGLHLLLLRLPTLLKF